MSDQCTLRYLPFGFEKDYNIRFYDCDTTGKIRMSALLRYTADVAGIHYEKKGFGHKLLWEKNMVFLLAGESIRIHRYPVPNETVTFATWENKVKGHRFYRMFEIYDAAGALIVSAASTWLLANPETRQILRPTVFDFQMELHPEREPDTLPIEKLGRDSEQMFLSDYQIKYSDLDGNGHVNNAVYANIACDALPFEEAAREYLDFRINYHAEALYGDTISLYRCDAGGSIVVKGFKGREVCFECEFRKA